MPVEGTVDGPRNYRIGRCADAERESACFVHPQDELDAPKVVIGRLVYLLADERGVTAWRSNRRNLEGRQVRPAGPHAVRRGTASSRQQRRDRKSVVEGKRVDLG